MRRVRQLWQDESGAVLIFVAVVIFALAAMAILAVDISKLFVTRVQLQNAADAGALAGAEMFIESTPYNSDGSVDGAAIEGHARDVARLNTAFNDQRRDPVSNITNVSAAAVTSPSDPTYGTVTVTTHSVVSQYFTPVTALMQGGAVTPSTGNVSAVAAARAAEVVKVQCLKPWSIPDRWDDSGKPGWPQWKNNDHWNSEKFTDVDGDRLWSPGEQFFDGVDRNSGGGKPTGGKDGQYTSEFYHPVLTGYVASKDLGRLMTFKVASPGDAYEPGQFYPVDLPIPDSPDVGADRYRWNIGNCNPTYIGPGDYLATENGNMIGPTAQGVADLISQDPKARWDTSCNCVKDSQFGNKSPRIIFIPLHDPRIPLEPGKTTIRVVKIAAMFIENVQGRDVQGRFMKVQAPGQQGPPGYQGAGYVFNLSLIR